MRLNTISLFSGAGGLDIGISKAGFDIVWANDFDKDACESYKNNVGSHIRCGDIVNFKNDLTKLNFNVDLLIGGPPCQGFSVAGKMDPKDPRSKHVWTYVDILKTLLPKAFIMENVKALGVLDKWAPLRNELLKEMRRSRLLSEYGIATIDASDIKNLSFYLKNGIEVKIGYENFADRLMMLTKTLRDSRLVTDRVQYIDVRFENAVVGPKE